MSRCGWCGGEPCWCGLDMASASLVASIRACPSRVESLTRLATLLRSRLLALEAHMLAEFTIEAVAKALFARWNPDDAWSLAPDEIKATHRTDAEAALMAAFRGPGRIG